MCSNQTIETSLESVPVGEVKHGDCILLKGHPCYLLIRSIMRTNPPGKLYNLLLLITVLTTTHHSVTILSVFLVVKFETFFFTSSSILQSYSVVQIAAHKFKKLLFEYISSSFLTYSNSSLFTPF